MQAKVLDCYRDTMVTTKCLILLLLVSTTVKQETFTSSESWQMLPFKINECANFFLQQMPCSSWRNIHEWFLKLKCRWSTWNIILARYNVVVKVSYTTVFSRYRSSVTKFSPGAPHTPHSGATNTLLVKCEDACYLTIYSTVFLLSVSTGQPPPPVHPSFTKDHPSYIWYILYYIRRRGSITHSSYFKSILISSHRTMFMFQNDLYILSYDFFFFLYYSCRAWRERSAF